LEFPNPNASWAQVSVSILNARILPSEEERGEETRKQQNKEQASQYYPPKTKKLVIPKCRKKELKALSSFYQDRITPPGMHLGLSRIETRSDIQYPHMLQMVWLQARAQKLLDARAKRSCFWIEVYCDSTVECWKSC
jgi:hypothetical protein